jgi:hypothetical protein
LQPSQTNLKKRCYAKDVTPNRESVQGRAGKETSQPNQETKTQSNKQPASKGKDARITLRLKKKRVTEEEKTQFNTC